MDINIYKEKPRTPAEHLGDNLLITGLKTVDNGEAEMETLYRNLIKHSER